MTDDELWELMQRNLDNDLSPEEQQVLFTVLDKEPLLKQKYDRLQQVSQRLAELPAVTPPFSIVDSILPKLESAAANPAALAAESQEDAPTEVKRLLAQTSKGARRKPAYAWLARMGSVAVAACLLVGVLVLSDNANKQLEDDVSHNGATVPPLESEEPPAIYGPPVPPPSTDTTPTSISVEEPTVENRARQNLPRKEPVQDQPPVQTTTAAVSEEEPEQGVNEPLPPVIPKAPVVPPQQKTPAFPIGLEEKSDDYVYDQSSGTAGDEDDDDDDKESKEEKKERKEQEKQEKEERKQSEREDD
ncbi:hypothetical protein ACAF76_013980 [Brevibacillus sp. TJ4]|uniref:hypothetical protein n=1 Tax=Brevibacillus sp. TJ4 TaxID=3234853 RepID=UPI0037CCDE0C